MRERKKWGETNGEREREREKEIGLGHTDGNRERIRERDRCSQFIQPAFITSKRYRNGVNIDTVY